MWALLFVVRTPLLVDLSVSTPTANKVEDGEREGRENENGEDITKI